nr:SHOCT domain-containing protein [Streptomyces resistomycificus]
MLIPALYILVVTEVETWGRTVWRGRRGPWRVPAEVGLSAPAGDSPIAMLGRRFAAGEIGEDEYWRRLSVLDEQFGGTGRGGAT